VSTPLFTERRRCCHVFYTISFSENRPQSADKALGSARGNPAERTYLFTSESVSEGHPDKLADRISDTVLDRFLRSDPSAKVACETFIAYNLVEVAGEFRTSPPELFITISKEIPDLVRQVIRDTGYNSTFSGIDLDTCEIRLQLN
jgi:S-adenosylmethionine synthetase